MTQWYSANAPLTTWIYSLFCIKTFAWLRTSGLHLESESSPTFWFLSRCSSVGSGQMQRDAAYSWTCMYLRVACSVGTVAAPVIREEGDFDLPSRKDTLQAGLLWRVTHVLHHPLQQLQERQGGGENTQFMVGLKFIGVVQMSTVPWSPSLLRKHIYGWLLCLWIRLHAWLKQHKYNN